MLLSISGIKKGFGTDVVLSGATFRLERREKVALVGRNGTGKTTLLRIMAGEEEPDAGSVNFAKGVRIGYLKQLAPVDPSRSVLGEAEAARSHVLALKRRLEELEVKLESGATDEDLEEYASLHEHFIEAEGYSAERDVRTVLLRMGFTEDELQKPSGKLSGGETTRLALARLMLEEPDLLILDEPTNHLDLQATQWLEGWLRSYPGAVLVVSHDRAFLENFGQRFLELRDGVIASYPGPFAKFRELRKAEDARRAEMAKRQQQQIDRMDEYVRRFMGSERTAQARGRLKLLNRLIATRTEAPKDAKTMAAGWKTQKRSGDLTAEVKGLSVGYGDTVLIKGLDWTVRRGERWGIVGENGSGKSSLIRTLLGVQPALAGTVRLGANVEAGYFAQDAGEFDPDQSPLDVLVDLGLKPPAARDLLGRYLFSGDDVFRPVRTFSGGERNKLALACLTALAPNLLVLDEPTNHLDMDSREALAEVLRGYDGTLLLVSHDRWLLGEVTDHTLDVRRDGVRLSMRAYSAPDAPAQTNRPSARPTALPAEPELSPREISKRIERMAKEVFTLEDRIATQESELASLSAVLSDPPSGDALEEAIRAHGKATQGLSRLMAEWENAQSELERLQRLQ